MTIEQYGIKLVRITIDDIELIRAWRNKNEIRSKMGYRKYISMDMQKKWFETVDNKFNYYFLIEYNNKKVGVINAKNIIPSKKYGEGGIFIWDEKNEIVAVLASLCLLNASFFVLDIFNKSFIQILKDNRKAVLYNKFLGYIKLPGQSNKVRNEYYILTKEDYIRKSEKLNEAAKKITNDYELPRIRGKVSEKNLKEINDIITQNHEKSRRNK